MEDIRPYNVDFDDTLRERDDRTPEFEVSSEDEVPFEIPRD